jgi:uncharacterized protein DUF5678
MSSKYESQIQKLVEEDRVGAARKLVEEALWENPSDPTLLSWQEVLAPGRVFGRRPVNLEGTAEHQWFTAHSGQHRGQWVAVTGEELLAHASTLQELSSILKKLSPTSLPVIQHIE